jgi:hypothetical protein
MSKQKESKALARVSVNLESPQSLMKFAVVLKTFIIKQNLYTNIQGKNYVNVEGWQFAGGNMGLFPVVESCERLNRSGEVIYQANVAIYHHDKIVSRGIAVCSSKEKGKGVKDEYVIASMAQTRAVGKAYRLIIGWLMKAAGYEATPAEEIKEGKEAPKTPEKPENSSVNYVEQVRQHLQKKGAKDDWKALEMLYKLTGEQFNKFSEITQAKAKQILLKLLMSKK